MADLQVERAAARQITPALRNFFMAEIRNESSGGVSPSTLFSATDSLAQGGAEAFDLDTDDVIRLSVITTLVSATTEIRWLLGAAALDIEGSDEPATPPQVPQTYRVEVLRTVANTVTVEAADPESAVDTVDAVGFELPELLRGNILDGYEYVVYDEDDEELYRRD